jgi:hypothetical protein
MRNLTSAEVAFLNLLLEKSQTRELVTTNLLTVQVETMNDGGMGSLSFAHSGNCSAGMVRPCDSDFLDTDGVPVSVVLSLDQAGEIIELDVWKGDFSAVKRFPTNSAELNVRKWGSE